MTDSPTTASMASSRFQSWGSNIEVTTDDYRHTMYSSSASKTSNKHSFRLPKLLKARRKRAVVEDDSRSMDGMQSIGSDANSMTNLSLGQQTISSLDTLKASNRQYKIESDSESKRNITSVKHKNPWSKLKKIMGSKNGSSVNENDPSHMKRTRSTPTTTTGTPSSSSTPKRGRFARRRSSSDTGRGSDSLSCSIFALSEQQLLDEAIRGRLDGVDVLSLGPARFKSIRRNALSAHAPSLSTADMVQSMIAASGGRDPPEVILDGFIPDRDDRWTVRIEESSPQKRGQGRIWRPMNTSASNSTIPSVDSSSSGEDGPSIAVATPGLCDDLPSLPIQDLLESLWGSQYTPPPSHKSRSFSNGGDRDDLYDDKEEDLPPPDDIVQLAAQCSVPIDVDDDTFIIDTAEHLRSVHDIAAASLQGGNLEDAMLVFSKILRGLENTCEGEPQYYLVGTTRHNMGVVLLWQSKWEEALDNFEKAVTIRTEALPPNHADVAVSLSREAIALFALSRLDGAALSLDRALKMHVEQSSTRAKLLNNFGCVQYQRQDFDEALKAFVGALEIQRLWLDKNIRRETTVYDAAVTLGNMGKLHVHRKDYTLAHLVYEEALMLQTTVFRKDHDLVLMTLGSLAYTTAKEGQYKKSVQMYRGILRSQESRFGSSSRQCMETSGLMASILIKQQNYDEAIKLLNAVHKWQRANLPPAHPAIRHTRDTIKKVEQNLEGGEATVWI